MIADRVTTKRSIGGRAVAALGLALLASAGCLAAEEPRSAGSRPSASQLGRVEMSNSGTVAAQEPFLRGLAALHSFWYDEAADSFREAQKADPGFALAYWGEAMTHNHPIWQRVELEAGREALARLGATAEERAAKAATEREKLYLAAVEELFAPGEGEKRDRDRAYSAAMERLSSAYPEDREAAAFYALSLQGLQPAGAADPRLNMRSAAVLEEVFGANPEHPGAAHYLIHAYDDPVHAPLGRRAARVYARIALSAHHALHMPSHIFVQLGMWQEVVASNHAAYQASVAWVERRGHPIGKRDFHSLSWLHYGYLQLGRLAAAQETLEIALAAAQESGDQTAEDVAQSMAARQAIETGSGLARNVRVETAVAPPVEAKELACGAHASHSYGADEAIKQLFAAGFAAARRGDPAAARNLAERLAKLAGSGDSVEDQELRIMARELSGLADLGDGHLEQGFAALAEAARIEDELGFPSGPPSPIKPAHELYGEELAARGRLEQAATELAKALERTPNRPAALLAAARTAAKAGQAELARERYATLAGIWQGADPGFAPLAEARAFLAGEDAPRPAP